MSCEQNPGRAAAAAAKSGIAKSSSRSGFIAGSTTAVGPALPQKKERRSKPSQRDRRRLKNEPVGKKSGRRLRPRSKVEIRRRKGIQPSFFDLAGPATAGDPVDRSEKEKLPTQRDIQLGPAFSPDELQTISLQLRFGAAAASRQLRELGSGRTRGVGHGDPRPLDWTELDRKQFQFLVDKLAEARRGSGCLDTSSLSKPELIELWEFCRFEADRASRNIDHLGVPGGPIGGPAAEYLIGNHKLEARFFNHVAGQIEAMAPVQELAAEAGRL